MTDTNSLLSAKVLIVDDEPMIRSEIVWRFGREGFTSLHEAASGNEALNFHQAQGADLVITDIRMANGSGIELMEALRSEGASCLPVILAMTAYADFSLQEIYGRHVDAFFQKPFRLDDLISASIHFLGLRKQLAKGSTALQALSFVDEMGQALTMTNMRLQRLCGSVKNGQVDTADALATMETVMTQNRQILRFLAEIRGRLQESPEEPRERIDVVELAQAQVARWRPRFEDRNLNIRVVTRSGLPMVLGDGMLLEHALHAMIESAFNASRFLMNSQITLSIDATENKIAISCEYNTAPHPTPRDPHGHGELPDTLLHRIAQNHGGHFSRHVDGNQETLVFLIPTRL